MDVRLRMLSLAVQQAQERVLHFPSTFRDVRVQVSAIQRGWLMTSAYLDYNRVISEPESFEPDARYIGCFTTDPAVVQLLYSHGIPVWFIRPDISILDSIQVRAIVRLVRTSDSQIAYTLWQCNSPPLYSGLAGLNHLDAVTRLRLFYIDISQVPLLVRYDATSYTASAPSSNDSPAPPNRAQSSGRPSTIADSRSQTKPIRKPPCAFYTSLNGRSH